MLIGYARVSINDAGRLRKGVQASTKFCSLKRIIQITKRTILTFGVVTRYQRSGYQFSRRRASLESSGV